jgi:glucose-1-phosphate cytidylyltransferase
MKVVILAGGLGTRLSEETGIRPKPMVEIGSRPILWHIMKHYSHYGFNDFIILCGYKGITIKDYFMHYKHSESDFTIDLSQNKVTWMHSRAEDWRVTLLDTGLSTMTGGRLKRARDNIGDDTFCLTYGDGVSDVNITELVAFHRRSGLACTVTAAEPPGRFGVLGLQSEGDRVMTFREKDSQDVGLVNSGFFVCEPAIFDFIEGDATSWELEPLTRLVEEGQLAAYRHRGFWQPMDSLRDKTVLDQLWSSGKAPWKVW